jgi:biotin synthase-like enzyme
MPHLLSKARTKLSELETIINKLIRIQSRSKVSFNLLNAWRNEQTRIKEIQDDIRSVKSSLNIMLGATSSYVHRSTLVACSIH